MRVTLVFCCLLNYGCTNVPPKKNVCDIYFQNANAQIVNYRKTLDISCLNNAQLFLDSALGCDDIKKKVIQCKYQIFMMQEKYIEGANFIDTLGNYDFDFTYKKKMYSSYLRGTYYKSIHDLEKTDSIFNLSIRNIEKYISDQKFKTIKSGEEAFYNLFFTKSRIYDSIILCKEIDSLKKIFLNEEILIEDLRKVTLESIDK